MEQQDRSVELIGSARDWIAGDPDPAMRDALEQVIETADLDTLEDLMGASLSFGTAGLRGRVGPGPNLSLIHI